MSTHNSTLQSIAHAIQISRAPFVTLGSVGVFWGTFSAMVPVLKDQVGASDAELGSSLIGGAIGGMIAMYFAPRMSDILGRFVLPALGLVMAVVLCLPIFVDSVALFFPMMMIIGLSLAGLDISANVRLSQLEERHGLHLMNVNHAMFSLCFGGAALLVSWMRSAGLDAAEIFSIMACVIVGAAGLMWEKNWQAVSAEDSETPKPASMPWLVVVMAGVMIFSSFVGENATESWSALFIERELGGQIGHGSLGPATLGGVMFVVRLMGQVFVERLGEERVLLASGAFGIIGALVLAAAPTQSVALCGIAIIAIGMAAIVPTANALLGKRVHREQRALALSRAWMLGMSGFFVGPSLIGYISEIWGLRLAFVVVAILISAIIPAVMVVQRSK